MTSVKRGQYQNRRIIDFENRSDIEDVLRVIGIYDRASYRDKKAFMRSMDAIAGRRLPVIGGNSRHLRKR